MKKTFRLFCLLALLGWNTLYAQVTAKRPVSSETDPTLPVALLAPLDSKRVNEIVQMLPPKPTGLGKPYHDRATWDRLRQTGKYDKLFREVEKIRLQKFPEWDEDGYMGMFTRGDSQTGKDMLHKRIRWLIAFTWAECLENKGRYLPSIENSLNELIHQKTWVNPRNFEERNYRGLVELSTAGYVHNIGQALYLLDDKISPAVHKATMDTLYARAFNPLMKTIQTGDNEHPWLTKTHNWNAACLAGITGGALAAIADRTERAQYVAIAERYIKNFVAGYLDDGYCVEGIAYFNYGFGNFVVLRETVWQATQGKIDYFKTPKIENMAAYPVRMEISKGVFPYVSDCPPGTRLDKSILYYVNKNLGLGLAAYDTLDFVGPTGTLFDDVMYLFPNSTTHPKVVSAKKTQYTDIRSYFDNAGVLVVRPANGEPGSLAVAFKGGNNGFTHNHNDLGSFNIVLGNELLMGDPGSIPYSATTFGPRRYEFKTMSSYGHAVPVVAGQLQETGAQARATVLKTAFTDQKDYLEMDITSAYPVPELTSLVRTFSYDRSVKGRLEIADHFGFTKPQPFETALTTRVAWKQTGPNQILLEGKQGKMQVDILAPPGGVAIVSEEIRENNGVPYTRIGIRLKQPSTSGTLAMTFRPIN